MIQPSTGYAVTMHLWVEECESGVTLLQPSVRTYHVQPPGWCYDDPVELEMHLDHLTKLQFLYDIRRRAKNGELPYLQLKDRKDYIPRGFMASYSRPGASEDEVVVIVFNGTSLRAA